MWSFIGTESLSIRNSYLRDARGSVYRLGRRCDLHLKVCFLILTTQMIKSLKKTMSPVLSDISIEWLFPETKEVLLSPVGSTFLFPGDSLISYAVVCDTTRYHANPKSVSAKCTHYCMRQVCIILDMASCVVFTPNFFSFKGPILYLPRPLFFFIPDSRGTALNN